MTKLSSYAEYLKKGGEFRKQHKKVIGLRGTPYRLLRTKGGSLVRPYNYRDEHIRRFGKDVPNALVWDLREYQERIYRQDRYKPKRSSSPDETKVLTRMSILDKNL